MRDFGYGIVSEDNQMYNSSKFAIAFNFIKNFRHFLSLSIFNGRDFFWSCRWATYRQKKFLYIVISRKWETLYNFAIFVCFFLKCYYSRIFSVANKTLSKFVHRLMGIFKWINFFKSPRALAMILQFSLDRFFVWPIWLFILRNELNK